MFNVSGPVVTEVPLTAGMAEIGVVGKSGKWWRGGRRGVNKGLPGWVLVEDDAAAAAAATAVVVVGAHVVAPAAESDNDRADVESALSRSDKSASDCSGWIVNAQGCNDNDNYSDLSIDPFADVPVGPVRPACRDSFEDTRWEEDDGESFAVAMDDADAGRLLPASPTTTRSLRSLVGRVGRDVTRGRSRSRRVATGAAAAVTVDMSGAAGEYRSGARRSVRSGSGSIVVSTSASLYTSDPPPFDDAYAI
ncbi:hypothetical protein HK101_006560 [Irineochytrium annulatum]|nr:hypothetical protein HK101_006560 [Irineochytrium annulatum]